uniref:Single domain-containing protein n=1 Tax=Magallana gigas TaxID=29159 RepID=K1RNJ4_MAGGI
MGLSTVEGKAGTPRNGTVGECPDGHKEGDSWTPLGGYCGGCACDANGWGCGSCSPYVITENCYHETNTTAPYPDCCPSLVCKDDPHFNPSKIELVGR